MRNSQILEKPVSHVHGARIVGVFAEFPGRPFFRAVRSKRRSYLRRQPRNPHRCRRLSRRYRVLTQTQRAWVPTSAGSRIMNYGNNHATQDEGTDRIRGRHFDVGHHGGLRRLQLFPSSGVTPRRGASSDGLDARRHAVRQRVFWRDGVDGFEIGRAPENGRHQSALTFLRSRQHSGECILPQEHSSQA